ncbi:hypothetical protein APHAL10511_001646 [Amanita phalloides]|nr:hypothetical protein APHAL10511_001646 [Amanita phalloides]
MKPTSVIRTLLVFTVAASAYASPRSTPHLLKESVDIPIGWAEHSTPSPHHIISLHIGLPQSNFPTLERHLYEVSDPGHPRYGQHLSKEEVEELVAPHPSSLVAVNEWLAFHGLGENDIIRSPAKDWITINIPVALVEGMLNAKYKVYKHDDTEDYLVRTTSYSLPEHLHVHVDVIQPTTSFGRFRNQYSSLAIIEEDTKEMQSSEDQIVDPVTGVTVDASCNQTITVNCLYQLYNAVGYKPLAKGGNSIGITGYLGQYANIEDLQSFYREQRPDALGTNFDFVSVNGGINSQNKSLAGSEANLDVQFAYGISFPTPRTFWSTAGMPPFHPDPITVNNTNEPYLDWLHHVLPKKSLPLAISTSYDDNEQTVPPSFAKRVCEQFAQLGARGVSLMFASGDFGVGDGNMDLATQKCFTNTGRKERKFIPQFPSSCPYVTSVGATQHIPEIAVSRFFSGGGFSNYFKRPAYQDKHVKEYLDWLPKGLYKGLYNPDGRAFPDVAAQGDFFRIWVSGVPIRIGGTSAASPAFTGFIALLNDARLRKKQRPLGFLNPLLYSKLYKGLNDITVGHNAGCGTYGFNATVGWDPVTGLGTPNFYKMRELLGV